MFSLLAVCYLFLGGIGAGACFVLAVLGLRAHAVFFRAGYAAAFGALALGALCLLVDLGGVDRALLLVVSPAPTFVTVGAWSLALLLALALCLLVAECDVRRRWPRTLVRVLQAATALTALVVATYTGLLLQSMPAVPLWASPLVPALFVASSLSGGTVLVAACACLSGTAMPAASLPRRLLLVDAVFIAIELVVVAAFVLTTSSAVAGVAATPTEHALGASFHMLTAGSDAGLFWLGFVGIGLVLPLAIELAMALRGRLAPRVVFAQSPLAVLFVSFCVLVGGFVMRWCIVSAGAHPTLFLGGM